MILGSFAAHAGRRGGAIPPLGGVFWGSPSPARQPGLAKNVLRFRGLSPTENPLPPLLRGLPGGSSTLVLPQVEGTSQIVLSKGVPKIPGLDQVRVKSVSNGPRNLARSCKVDDVGLL